MAMHSVHRGYCACFVVWGLLLLVLQCEGIGYRTPINCAYLECPAYNVVHTEAQFEIRIYRDATWIAFPVPNSRSFRIASTTGFSRLFDYKNGINRDGKNISITAPILVDIATPSGSSPFVVYFFVPEKYQRNTPLPFSNSDRPVILPPRKFAAVRRFGGFPTDKNFPKEAAALKLSLRGTTWQSASEVELYTLATYNAPYERDNRVNEILIWFD